MKLATRPAFSTWISPKTSKDLLKAGKDGCKAAGKEGFRMSFVIGQRLIRNRFGDYMVDAVFGRHSDISLFFAFQAR